MRHARALLPGPLIALLAVRAWAGPLDNPHVGGVGFSGPTTGDLAALHWNPAALGLLGGSQVAVAGTARFTTTTVARAPINPATGAPTAGALGPSVTGHGRSQPFTWPPGPGFFLGGGLDVAGRFTIALAAYTPFEARIAFPTGSGALPTRYQGLVMDLRNFALVPGVAFRIGPSLRVGLAPGFLFSSGRLVFDQDTALAGGSAGLGTTCDGAPCGAENPAAAARYDLRSSMSPFGSSPSFTLAGGLLWKSGRWTVALAYTSRPLGKESGGVEVDSTQSVLTLPGGASVCPRATDACVASHLEYRLPDVFTAGVATDLSRRAEVALTVRYLNYSLHDRFLLRFTAPASVDLAAAGVPERLVLYRGFRDSWDVRTRAVLKLANERVRVGVALRAETATVPERAVNALAPGGLLVEPALMAQVRIWRLTMHAGYAFGFMPTTSVTASYFNSVDARACADAGGDLALEACRVRAAGAARPSANGRYQTTTQTFSFGLAARF